MALKYFGKELDEWWVLECRSFEHKCMQTLGIFPTEMSAKRCIIEREYPPTVKIRKIRCRIAEEEMLQVS